MGMVKYIIGNWKMNPTTRQQALNLVKEIAAGIKSINLPNLKVALCPPVIWLNDLKEVAPELSFGAQDVFFEREGTFTGKISPAMLKDSAAEYCLIGHSETRRFEVSDSEMIHKKIKACLEFDITPIYFFGDLNAASIEEEDFDLIAEKLLKELNSFSEADIEKILFVYEPVFAISQGLGTGKAVPENHALRAIEFIRNFIRKNFKKQNLNVRILYGGSVDARNGPLFLNYESINGLVAGGASLLPDEFISLIKNCVFKNDNFSS